MSDYDLHEIKSYRKTFVVSLIFLLIGTSVLVLSNPLSSQGVFKAIFNIGLIVTSISLLSIAGHVYEIPNIKKRKANILRDQIAFDFLNSIIKNLEGKLLESKNWRRGQNLRLILCWLNYIKENKFYSFIYAVKKQEESINLDVINTNLFSLLCFPSTLNPKDPFHKNFAIHLFELYRVFYNKHFDFINKPEQSSEQERESFMPYPVDYLWITFHFLRDLSKSEPNNYSLRPEEAYRAGVASLLGLKINE